MSRMRVPRQHRRYSLPGTSTLMPLGFTRGIPEGSDMFQKALEDLCSHEPDHGLTKSDDSGGYNGLGNIQEGDESDHSEEEQEPEETNYDVSFNDDVDGENTTRRHSSPNCYNGSDETLNTEDARKREIDSIMKTHNKLRLAYFKRHGHWPAATSVPSLPSPRPKTSKSVRSEIAFGTKIRK